MLISSSEIEALKNLYQAARQVSDRQSAENAIYGFFSERPHLLMAGCEFDEYVNDPQTHGPYSMRFRKPAGSWFEIDTIECGEDEKRTSYDTDHIDKDAEPDDDCDTSDDGFRMSLAEEVELEELYGPDALEPPRPMRVLSPSVDGTLFFRHRGARADGALAFDMSFEEVLENIQHFTANPDDSERRLWTPQLWTPTAQAREREALRSTTSALLTAFFENKVTFDDVHWSQAEDIVAELLRRSGMEIHKIEERPQGGRDIIARGELIPGEEPIYLAVEVKHKAVVERPEVQTALWQNKHFPALMFITTGRFSAGVFKEKTLPENRLRLVLKDGEALWSMIRNSFKSFRK